MNWAPADWFNVTALAVIVVADAAFAVLQTPTISRRFREYGYRMAALPYVWGLLAGHFWGSIDGLSWGSRWTLMALALSCLVVVYIHALLRLAFNLPNWFVLVYVLVGVPVGAFLWPQ